MLNQLEQPAAPGKTAFLQLGFRPFFAGAAGFAVVSMLAWLVQYTFNIEWYQGTLPATSWHAHEMIYGYSLAVIAGFLLTAVKNWTGVQTLHHIPLLLLFLLWLAARILLAAGNHAPVALAAVADCLFIALLVVAVAHPVIKVRQWKQMGILSKLVLLLLSNVAFYAGVLGLLPDGIRIGLYSGVYLVMALIFAMARRVLPFFIQNAVDEQVTLKNRKWLDISSLVLFLVFWIADIIEPDSLPVAVLAGILCILHTLRLADWFTPGTFRKPLLWVLYLGYAALAAGFALKAAVYAAGVSPFLALHAFTYGGIGLFTLGMMARVTLGHTGRNVFEPPALMAWMFSGLLAGVAVRVLFPLFDPQHYSLWMGLSQLFWIGAFILFLSSCLPMLIRPRIDGRPG
jgi:uncharacterized protein involved in response to NO